MMSELKFSTQALGCVKHFFRYSEAEPLSVFSASRVLGGVAFNIFTLLKICMTLFAQC